MRDLTDGTIVRGRVKNLGLGGACVEVEAAQPHPFRIDGGVLLEVTAPTLWDPLHIRAKIAWLETFSAGHRLGVRFEHAEHGGLGPLYSLLSAHSYDR